MSNSQQQTDGAGVGTLGYYLRLLECRHRILRYTKRVIQEATSPITSRTELNALQADLTSLKNTPDDPRLSRDRLRLKVHSPEAGDYIALHML